MDVEEKPASRPFGKVPARPFGRTSLLVLAVLWGIACRDNDITQLSRQPLLLPEADDASPRPTLLPSPGTDAPSDAGSDAADLDGGPHLADVGVAI